MNSLYTRYSTFDKTLSGLDQWIEPKIIANQLKINLDEIFRGKNNPME